MARAKTNDVVQLKPGDLVAPLGGQPGTPQFNPKIRSVRYGLGSNVGHPPAEKTLWIFGAGASLHLGFPLSFNFFSESIRLLTNQFSDANELSVMLGGLTKSNGKRPTKADFAKVKTDPMFALQEMGLWDFMRPAHADLVVFQYLLNEWKKLPNLLEKSGLRLTPKDILERNPENLIAEIRNLPAIRSKRSYAKKAREDAISCIQSIYFHTLSHFNDKARQKVKDGSQSLYNDFVKAIDIEGGHQIISFNYDTGLDEAFFSHFTKSWEFGGVEIVGINGHPVGPGVPADVTFIKPHGSLNLMRCNNCGRAHLQWFRRYLPTGVGQQSAHNRRCVHCTKALPGRPELMGQFVVPPLYDKKAIAESKKAIRNAFAWTDNVVSIGFSFPEQDAYFLKCMADGLKRNKHNIVTLYIVGRDKKGAEATKRQLLRHASLQPFKRKLKVKAVDANGFEGVKIGGKDFDAPMPKAIRKPLKKK